MRWQLTEAEYQLNHNRSHATKDKKIPPPQQQNLRLCYIQHTHAGNIALGTVVLVVLSITTHHRVPNNVCRNGKTYTLTIVTLQ